MPAAPKLGEKLVPISETEQLATLIHVAEQGRDYASRRDAAIPRLFACTGTRLSR